ncbi:GNAT family N-acetyltransferase [Yersinia pseudotuberculosis]|uniref:GNAT family N-acetyltransferase n=1 Tax=Yersinia pseudotuberculosis TaxID=633 RepID=UPI0003D5953F|nr:GNAT family N-acetyltransferase [Yersinia pseudotuberculosis]AJJ70551.1 acetyltransferase domain protein [Yersinia pseudotuberculosis]PSH34809.1 acetyltransferase [Yersinia pseudotuberculosis]PSH40331.1 siderophore biosynthesis protein [Yersinia pseudotuberculosis]CNK23371.1 siderophore biosynthetic enzyme [Yersinia pseudotuberculosis]VEG87957.1 siderophore biosynthetic enzyme [Yersinia pseudotuberculosis]
MNAERNIESDTVVRSGGFQLRPLVLAHDVTWLTDWVNREYAHYWGMQGYSPQQVKAFYQELNTSQPGGVFVGVYQQQPAFLLERYLAQHDVIADYYSAQPDDVGMHILVAPPVERITGFTWRVFQAIMTFIFSDPTVARIVVEPDVRNEKIHRLNKRAGFVYQQQLTLPHKTAWLAFCTREQYRLALQKEHQ